MKRYQNTLKLTTERLIANAVLSSQAFLSERKSVGRGEPCRVLNVQLPDADSRPVYTRTDKSSCLPQQSKKSVMQFQRLLWGKAYSLRSVFVLALIRNEMFIEMSLHK